MIPVRRRGHRVADRGEKAGAAVLEAKRARNLAGMRDASGTATASAVGQSVGGCRSQRRRRRNAAAALVCGGVPSPLIEPLAGQEGKGPT